MSIYNRVTALEGDVLAAQADATEALVAEFEDSTVRVVTADTTLNFVDSILLVDASNGPIKVSLPDASGNTGQRQDVKKTDSSSNPVTIEGDGLIDGDPAAVLTAQGESITLVSDGLNRHIL
jgi:hypothetical protein